MAAALPAGVGGVLSGALAGGSIDRELSGALLPPPLQVMDAFLRSQGGCFPTYPLMPCDVSTLMSPPPLQVMDAFLRSQGSTEGGSFFLGGRYSIAEVGWWMCDPRMAAACAGAAA